MNNLVNFNDAELPLVQNIVDRRYGSATDIQQVVTELRLDPEIPVMTSCAGLYWEGHYAKFLICKIAEDRFRGWFFYRVHTQYGTGIPEYNDLKICVTHLLQVQADHESKGEHL